MGPTNLSSSSFIQERTPSRAAPEPILPRRPLLFFFSGDEATTRSNLAMSSSASAPRRSWPRFGAVPMTRCPDCTRTAPLKRLVTTTDKNGNLGREFVKCESKPEQGKVRFSFSNANFGFCLPISYFSSDLGFRVHLSDFRN